MYFETDYCNHNTKFRSPLFRSCQIETFDELTLKLFEIFPLAVKYENWDNNRNPCHIFIKLNNLEKLKQILKIDNNLLNNKDKFGHSPFHEACIQQNLEIIKYLMQQKNIDINLQNRNGFSPLHIVCELCNFILIKNFIKRKDTKLLIKDELDRIPLYYFIQSYAKNFSQENNHDNFLDIINLFSSKDNKLFHEKDFYNRTLLHTIISPETKNTYLINLILEKSFSVINVKDRNRKTASHYAVEFKYYEIVELMLIYNGLNINGLDRDGTAAIHTACKLLDEKLFKILCHNKSTNVNLRNKNGYSLIMIAIEHCKSETDLLFLLKLLKFIIKRSPYQILIKTVDQNDAILMFEKKFSNSLFIDKAF